jgi:MFS family permease
MTASVLTASEEEVAPRARSRGELASWVGLAILSAAMMLSVVDRQILVIVTEPLKKSFGINDTEVGLLNGLALTLVSAAATYPMGILADRLDRRRLLAACILLWCLAAGACGFAHSFAFLFGCSMGIAIGEAVLGPINYSLIADLFPRERWMIANYVFYLTNVLGGAAALALSGAAFGFADTHRSTLPAGLAGLESWRIAMIIVALPGPLVAIAALFMRTRHAVGKGAVQRGGAILPYLRAHLRTLAGVFLGFGFAAAANVSLAMWVLIGLTRNFGETPADVGLHFGIVTGISSLSGVLLSSLLVKRLRPRFGDLTLLRVAQLGIAAGAVAMIAIPFCAGKWQVYGAQLVASLLMTIAISLSPTFLQNIAPNSIRGRVIALGGLTYVVLNALTPIIVGMISDSAFGRQHGLYWAMLVVSLPCALAGVAFLFMAARDLVTTFDAAEKSE